MLERFTKVLLLTALTSCGGAPASPDPDPTPAADPRPPRLVIAVVLDQLGWATLERYMEYLPEDGALRRLASEGVYHRVEYQHAATYTAAGHSSIFTGTSPRVHGVMSNRVFDVERGEIASCDDGSCPVFGVEEAYASPTILTAPTVGDALHLAHPNARVVSVSYKDRGSVLPAGQHPDAVAFWDKTHARFTTSSFYGEQFPAWLEAFNEAHPSAPHMTAWEPLDAALLERVLGPDEREGEGGLGFGATFPHDPTDAGDELPGSAFRATPQATEYLLELARAAIDAHELGADETPDLLTVSISGTDYVGHTFGAGSWEYLDNLMRVDAALGRFLRDVEADVGPIAVMVTSDHGHADVPQSYEDGGRVHPQSVLAALEAVIDEELGEGDWLLSYTEPFIYLTEAAQADGPRQRIIELALEHVPQQPGVHRVFDVARIPALAHSDDPMERLVYESVAPSAPGQLFVVVQEHWIVDKWAPEARGASHGTPWPYDREVPALFLAPGVTPLRSDTPIDQRRVARTIAALLGVPGPAAAPTEPLPGAPVF